MATVHCIGALVVDALSGPLPAYPIPRIKPQVNTRSLQFLPGGGAANTGSALSQIGVPVRIFSKVGADLNGAFLRQELARQGADVSQIRISDGERTPFTFVGVHPNGERTFIHTPGTNLSFCRTDIEERALFDCQFLLYQDLWVLPKLDVPSAPALLAAAQRRGITTLLDECYGLGPKRKVFEAVLPYCDLVLPSFEDLALLYPKLKPAELARKLQGMGARRVVLKLGRRGCLVATPTETVLIPSLADKVVDGTGAGDCFDAGFLAGLVHGLDDVAAAKIGSAAAAACLRHVGGAVGIPKFRELMRRCARTRAPTE
jgi:sugar/nucleoside kinase (ribokinase family)